MKKILLALAIAIFGSGCCGEGPATSKHSGNRYYPIKICSVGDMTGESCVEYAAKHYNFPWKNIIRITTLDNHTYDLNINGWSIIITNK